MNFYNKNFPVPHQRALWILRIDLLILVLFTVIGTLTCVVRAETDPLGAWELYCTVTEYITSSCVIAVGSAVLIDLTEREKELQSK